MHDVCGSIDLMEVACSAKSALTTEFEKAGYQCERIHYLAGYNLDRKAGTRKAVDRMRERKPRMTWISMPCTRLSSLQNLTERTQAQWEEFQRRQQADLRRSDEIADGVVESVEDDRDFAWEWPTTATPGWKSRGIQRILKAMHKKGRKVYWVRTDGCAFGMKYEDVAVMKRWTILTSSRQLYLYLSRRCSGDHEHRECRGPVAQFSSYYPLEMVKAVRKAMTCQWKLGRPGENSLDQDVDRHLLGVWTMNEEDPITVEDSGDGRMVEGPVAVEDSSTGGHQVMALKRQRFPQEMPSGKKLESIKQQMLRVHRASGHSSFGNLQRLLRARKAPDWAITLAGSLECPDCKESGKPGARPPASMSESPKLYEIVGTDVFDYVMEQDGVEKKYKFILWRDRASGLTMTSLLQEFGGEDGVKDWQPNSEDVIKTLTEWMMHNPCPSWVLSDQATYYSSSRMLEFLGRSGIGFTIAPAEAHWIMGPEESTIRILRATVDRLKKEHSEVAVPTLFKLATAGHNSSIGTSGYSPFQWTRGGQSEEVPLGVDVNKAMGGLLKMKDRARLAYEKAKAEDKYSKLNNSVGRPPTAFKSGQLVMLWRQKPRPGKMAGTWIGPMRMILQEGSTLWLATGASLIRAKTNQVRSCTKREEMVASLEGTAVIREPTTVDTLMRNFTGRFYWDVAGEVPSPGQQQDNLQPTEVRLQPDAALQQQQDSWRLDESGGSRVLVRVHALPRLQLFSPDRTTTCPVSLDELTGKRTTLVRAVAGGEPIEIKDDGEPRTLQDRWTGETRFEMVSRKARRVQQEKSRGVKRGNAEVTVEDEPQQGPRQKIEEQEQLQEVRERETSSLTRSLQERGPHVVDGVPESRTSRIIQGSSGSNECPVSECVLPGGHYGNHEDAEGNTFLWDPYSGRRELETVMEKEDAIGESEEDDAISLNDSEDELIPDDPKNPPPPAAPDDSFWVLEIEVDKDELERWSKYGPKKAQVRMSKKIQSKGKEVSWRELPLDKKKEFDLAQATELSNVLASKALRRLTAEESRNLNPKKVMQMRWVLTTKSSGTAKARLVILGFQAHNITEVESSSPTMAKLTKHVLLTVAASYKMRIRAGDVTSAFLQTKASLEDNEELMVWAPAELAILYGADPNRPILPLRVMRAFYGLIHAPRKWFEEVQNTMKSQGWTQLLSDKCAYVLLKDGMIRGVAGLHVDDFIIAGCDDDEVFSSAEKKLQEEYKFGKWEFDEFEFAGTYVQQSSDMSIHMSQKDYVEKWVEEMEIPKERMKQVKSPLTSSEISMLRGALGSLSWKATQSGPHYLADVSLLLSEVNVATVDTLVRTNKLIREVRRTPDQRLTFHAWNKPLDQLTAVVWADASNHNRPDKSSTMGLIAGIAPKSILTGSEESVSIVQWKSTKTPRQCLGSNGAEVQAITTGEDLLYHLRALPGQLLR